MKRLAEKLQSIKQKKGIGLMAHAVIGYPTLEKTKKIVEALIRGGADIIELQIPFSDPLADGPTIMRACEQSLNNKTKARDAFTLMKELSEKTDVPLLFMAYFNTVFRYGTEKFCQDASQAGASGLIIPDMNLDEEPAEHFAEYCKKYKLWNIRVISPASTNERIKLNGQNTTGFLYCTAHQGITGSQQELPALLNEYLQRVRRQTNIPLAVGFGIAKPEHLQALKEKADIAVVGSAIINEMNKSKSKDLGKVIERFMKQLTFSKT